MFVFVSEYSIFTSTSKQSRVLIRGQLCFMSSKPILIRLNCWDFLVVKTNTLFCFIAVPDDLLIAWVSILFVPLLPIDLHHWYLSIILQTSITLSAETTTRRKKGEIFYCLDLPKWRSTGTQSHNAALCLYRDISWHCCLTFCKWRDAHCLVDTSCPSVCQEASTSGALHHTLWVFTTRHRSVFIHFLVSLFASVEKSNFEN